MKVYMNRSQQARVYHTDEDCERLPDDADDYRAVDLVAIEGHYPECEYCAGTARSPGESTAYFE